MADECDHCCCFYQGDPCCGCGWTDDDPVESDPLDLACQLVAVALVVRPGAAAEIERATAGFRQVVERVAGRGILGPMTPTDVQSSNPQADRQAARIERLRRTMLDCIAGEMGGDDFAATRSLVVSSLEGMPWHAVAMVLGGIAFQRFPSSSPEPVVLGAPAPGHVPGGMPLRPWPPLDENHPLTRGETCAACRELLEPGHVVTLVAVGPGLDPDARTAALAGAPYNALSVPVHWACATGDAGPGAGMTGFATPYDAINSVDLTPAADGEG